MRSLIKEKKGLADKIILLLVMGFVLIMIFVFLFLAQLVLPLMVGLSQETNLQIRDAFQQTGDENIINASQVSFEPASQSLNNLEWISYTLFIIVLLVFLIMCSYVRTYPFLIFVWIVLMLVLLFLSLYLVVSYQDMVADATLGGYYTSWENTDFMLKNLPVIVLFMGVIGGIIMFFVSRNSEQALDQTGVGI